MTAPTDVPADVWAALRSCKVLSEASDASLAWLARVSSVHKYNKGERILSAVRSWNHPLVAEARGIGLMIGIVVTCAPDRIKELCIERGLLVLTAGTDVVRLLPPLVIADGEIDRGLGLLKDALDEAEEG